MLTRSEEEQLIRKAQEDISAFGPLYEHHFPIVFGFVFKRVRDEQTTGDITSQVFLKAIHALPNYKLTGAPFSAWLIRIALNEVRQFYRGSTNRTEISLSETDLSQIAADLIPENTRISTDLLIAGLNQLTPDESMYLDLRYFEGRSFKEMAEILSISPDNAKVRTYRVLKQLKSILLKVGPEK